MPTHYLTQHRFRLQLIDGVRFYRCTLCDIPVLICSRCDRGQRYCSKAHSQEARIANQHLANARCQGSRQGRRKHAERAARYRERRKHARHQAQCQVDEPCQASQPHHCVNQVEDAEHGRTQQKKVTYQGSPPPVEDDCLSLRSVATARTQRCSSGWPGQLIVRCHLCGRRCLREIRHAFLRRHQRSRTVQRRKGSDP